MSKNYDADVIVAGAGPAGATAALRLARAGLRVLMRRALRAAAAEAVRRRHQHPRALPLSVARRRRSTRIPTHPVSSLYLEGPSGDVFRMHAGGPSVLMIRRIEFDHLLASLRVEAGRRDCSRRPRSRRRAQDDDGVTLRTRDGRELRAPMVIAADGVNSVIARRLGMNPGWPAAQAGARHDGGDARSRTLRAAEPGTMSVFYGYGGAHGYAYIFPKRDHVNVGIGYVLPYFKEQVDVAPYDLQQRFVGDLRARGLMDGESQREHFTPFLIPDRRPAARRPPGDACCSPATPAGS